MFFSDTIALWLLVSVPIYYKIQKENKKERFIPLSTVYIVRNIKKSWKTNLYSKLPIIKTLSLILLIFALARPQKGYEIKETKIKGVDVALAIDTSKSMLAEDIGKKNRIETSKEVISKFINKQTNNRLGLIVFSGKSFTLSPMTNDYDFLMEQLKTVDTNIVKIDGTAIGEAISNAVYMFDKNKNKSKVLILLTDGENNMGKISPLRASEFAKIKGLKIYTIGVGKKEGTPLSIVDPYTGQKDFLRDFNGNIILSKINEEDLKNIAEITKGEYFSAEDKNTLDAIYSKINSLEKAEIITKNYMKYSEKFHYFLIPALILALMVFILENTILNILKTE